MSEFAGGVLMVYAAITVCVAGFSAICYDESPSHYDRRASARMFFLAPLWPVVGLIRLARWLVDAWHEAWGPK